MSLVKQPQAWVRVDMRRFVGSPDSVATWQGSVRPLADPDTYEDGFKLPVVESFGDVERALSDIKGNFEVSTFSFVTNDKDGFWRGLLNDPDTQYLTSSDIAFKFVSETGRLALVAARTAFRGQLDHPSPLPGRKFRVNAQSRVGSRLGPLNLDGPVLKRVYNKDDWPQIPRDFENNAVPFLWGELSDKGTVNADGDDVAMGMAMAKYLGPVFQGSTTGTPPTAPTFLPDPPAPTYVRYGPGGSTTWSYAVVVRTANGHTRLGTPVTITGLPNNDHFTGGEDDPDDLPTNGVSIHLVQYSTALQAEVTGADLWVKLGAPDSSHAWHKMDAAGQMFNTSDNEIFAGPTGYMDNGDDSHFKASPPPPATNTAQITPGSPGVAPGSIFYDFFGLLGHKGKIIQIFGSNLAESPEYEAIDIAEVGEHFLLGGDDTGVTLTVNGHTYFGFYAKGPKAEAAKNGTFPFRVNMCGWHEDNDVSNPMIDQAFYVYQDVFTQLSGGENNEGYQSGDRLEIPSFSTDPSIPILQSTTFQACQDVSAGYLGSGGVSPSGSPFNSLGYLATVYLDSLDTTWGEFIADMNRTFECDLGENHHGQLIAAIMNDLEDPDDGLLLREKIEIIRVEDAGAIVDEQIENVINFQFDWHPIDTKYRSGLLTKSNDESIEGYGRRIGQTIDMRYTRDPATANDAASRRLLHYMLGPSYPSITCKIRRAMEVELGQQARFQHTDFVTSDAMPIYVRRHKFSWARGEVTIVGRDRRGMVATRLAADSLGAYNTVTDEERVRYFFVSNESGRLPDGSLGSRIF